MACYFKVEMVETTFVSSWFINYVTWLAGEGEGSFALQLGTAAFQRREGSENPQNCEPEGISSSYLRHSTVNYNTWWGIIKKWERNSNLGTLSCVVLD